MPSQPLIPTGVRDSLHKTRLFSLPKNLGTRLLKNYEYDDCHGQLKSASLSVFSFDGLWFFSSADLLSAPAQSSLKLRLVPLQALHDTSIIIE